MYLRENKLPPGKTVNISTASSYSKTEEVRLPLLFLNNNDPLFCTLLFATHILDLVFLKFQTLKKYQVNLIN
jgi:hypothetical protein